MQEEHGIEDSVEQFMRDAEAEVAMQRERYGIVWDAGLTRRFVEGSGDTYRFLRSNGVAFNRFIERPKQHTAHRMVDLDDTFSLQKAFLSAFEERGIEVRYGHRGRRLIVDAGRVTGMEVETPAGPSHIAARAAVVLATGGYQAGPELRRRYQPEHLAATPYLGVPTCRGEGHLMGQAVGGDLINMTMVQPLVIVGSALVEDSIAVNVEGCRFHDEAGPYDDRVAALLEQPDRSAFYVFDDITATNKRHLVDQMPRAAVSAPTLAELASLIGAPADALEATVREWNALVDSGATPDPAFGRVVMPVDRRGTTWDPSGRRPWCWE